MALDQACASCDPKLGSEQFEAVLFGRLGISAAHPPDLGPERLATLRMSVRLGLVLQKRRVQAEHAARQNMPQKRGQAERERERRSSTEAVPTGGGGGKASASEGAASAGAGPGGKAHNKQAQKQVVYAPFEAGMAEEGWMDIVSRTDEIYRAHECMGEVFRQVSK